MSKYSQGAFRNTFEQRLYETMRDGLSSCKSYADANDYPYRFQGDVYHNVQSDEFHGELSTTDTFADPQSREIDVLLELETPKNIRFLTSAKDSEHRQSLEHVGDYEGLLHALRANPQGWLYWAMVVARKGFQSGCEETAKRSDIALVPPITGSVSWLSVITEEEVLNRISDAVKIFILGESWRRSEDSYKTGDVYNAIYVATREPSGMLGSVKIRGGDGTETPMRDFIGDAIKKPANRHRIPLSRSRTYVPFFEAPMISSISRDGSVVSSPVASTIMGTSAGMKFFRVRTDKGRELIADAQRALYTVPPNRTSRKLVRVDSLKVGTSIVCTDEDGTNTRMESVTSVEEINPVE